MLEHLKTVRNGLQSTKTKEDGEIFWINAYPPTEKQSNNNWNTSTHLENRTPRINVP